MKKNKIMKMIRFILIVLCVTAILGSSCGNNDDESSKYLHLGDTVVLAINDSVSFDVTDNDKLTVGFEEVLSDNRLSDCTLAYGIFEAKIELLMFYKTKEFNIPFTINGCTTKDFDIYKDTLDFRFHIYRLEPFDRMAVKKSSDYKIKLKVEQL
jgi:hypothetical protein